MKSRGEGLVLPRHLLVRFLLGHGLGAIRRLGCGTPVSDLSRLLERHEQKRKPSLWQRRGYPSPGKREHEAWSTPRRSSVACICTVSRIGLGKWGPTKGGQGLERQKKLLGVYTNMHPRLLSGGPAADRGGRSPSPRAGRTFRHHRGSRRGALSRSAPGRERRDCVYPYRVP